MPPVIGASRFTGKIFGVGGTRARGAMRISISIPIPIPLRHQSGTRRRVYIRACIRTREGAYTVRAGQELFGRRLALRARGPGLAYVAGRSWPREFVIVAGRPLLVSILA